MFEKKLSIILSFSCHESLLNMNLDFFYIKLNSIVYTPVYDSNPKLKTVQLHGHFTTSLLSYIR